MSYTYLNDNPCENSTSFAERVGVSSVASFADIPASVLSRLNLTHEKSCYNGSETESFQSFQSGMMSLRLTADHGEERLMSSAAVFPAKIFQQREKVPESKGAEVVCGNTWRELLAKYCRKSYSWKTHQCLWGEDLPWFSVTLPNWGMMRDGVLWERIMSPLRTSVTGSGLWPTPCLPGNGGSNGKAKMKKMLNWPTPRSCSAMAATITPQSAHAPKRFPNLETVVGRKQWPTPQVDDSKNSGNNEKRRTGLTREVRLIEGPSGQLNPTWVEWLMVLVRSVLAHGVR